RELRMLDQALDECVVDAVSRAVVVTGPPGIGKSRLTSEWITRGGRGGVVKTLFARADPSSASSAWALVQLLLRDAAGLREADAPEAQFAKLSEHLVKRLGEDRNERAIEFVAEVIGLRNQQPPSALLLASRSNPEVMREQVRRALHDWLDAEALGQPILLVLEDLHWGDTPSVDFLIEAMRQQRPMLVLALARPDVERRFPEFCERAVMRLRLPGLGARAAQQLIEFALKGKVDEATSARLIRTTDGNPFYLEELIRRVAAGSSDWPETVIAMAQSRIDQLEPEARCVLLAASVFGERCWDAGIAEIVDGNLDVSAILRQLTQEEIVLAADDSRYASAREYRFRHALFRDAAHAMIAREDRCSSHGMAAGWLERNLEQDARLLADHYEAAEDYDRARPWLMRAAKKAIDAGDLLVAAELAKRGASFGAQGVDRGRFLMLRAYAECARGEYDQELTREALELLPVGTPLWWLALGVLVFGACILDKHAEAAPYVALAATAPFTRGRDVPLGQGLVTLVGGLVLLGKPSVAESVLERARRSADDTQPDPVFEALLSGAQCALEAVAPVGGRWQLERALLGGRRCAAELGALGALHGQSVVLYYTGVAAMHLGCYEEARRACLHSCELVQRVGLRAGDAWPHLFLAKAYLRLGQPHEAIRAVEPIRDSRDANVRQMLPILLGEAQLRLGNPRAAEAEVLAAFSGKSPRLQRLAACVLSRAQLSGGRPTEALQTIQVALATPSSNGLESEVELLTLHTECLLACDRPAEAQMASARARAMVLELAASIADPELRRSFLENVEPCARALTLFGQLS
ncbi:MAG TPA: AAA family ATPase, partial [Polyangiaceae bacterium]|nr:AAA family ATPase [Polyangiaceae bacterium]